MYLNNMLVKNVEESCIWRNGWVDEKRMFLLKDIVNNIKTFR